jgi:hypothetical protein
LIPGTKDVRAASGGTGDDRLDYDALTDLFLGGSASPSGGLVQAQTLVSMTETVGTEPDRLCPPACTPAVEAADVAGKSTTNGVPGTASIEGLIIGHLPTTAMTWPAQYAKSLAEQTRRPVGIVRLVGGETWVDLVLPRGAALPVRSRVGHLSNDGNELEGVLAEAVNHVGHWIIRVDEVSEVDLARTPGLTGLVLLTGADAMAVTASYRTIKSLVQGSSERLPPLRVAIMGADDESAALAEKRIVESARMMLDFNVEIGPRVARVGAGSTLSLHHAAESRSPAEIVALIAALCARKWPRANIREEQGPTRVEEPAKVPVGDDPLLPLHEIAAVLGLRPVEFHCPIAPRVLLGVSDDGNLHLVANGEGAERDLLGVASWVDQHGGLLQAALKQQNLRTDTPTLHVVSRDARACRALLDTGIRAHLAVEAGGKWVVRPLN